MGDEYPLSTRHSHQVVSRRYAFVRDNISSTQITAIKSSGRPPCSADAICQEGRQRVNSTLDGGPRKAVIGDDDRLFCTGLPRLRPDLWSCELWRQAVHFTKARRGHESLLMTAATVNTIHLYSGFSQQTMPHCLFLFMFQRSRAAERTPLPEATQEGWYPPKEMDRKGEQVSYATNSAQGFLGSWNKEKIKLLIDLI